MMKKNNKKKKSDLNTNLSELQKIVSWFEDPSARGFDIEEGIKKIKEGAIYLKEARDELKEMDNEFKEVEKLLK